MIGLRWLLVAGVAGAMACKTDCSLKRQCTVDGGGQYFLLEPEAPTGEVFVFLHGAKRDNVEMLENIDEDLFLDAGIRLVLPDSADGRWAVSRGPNAAKKDVAFLAEVANTLRQEGLADGGIGLGGHSVGSSMTWFTACYEPGAFDVYNATSGGFWAPEPTACNGPVALRHTHGTADGMVPLEGRTLGGGAAQSNVYDGIDLWAENNGCEGEPEVRADEGHDCAVYQGCEAPLEFCLHDDGHKLLPDWEERALDWILGVL